MKLYNLIVQKLFTGNPRTVKANKNIIASFAIKGVSIVVGFLMVRVTLDYLDQTRYGIWLTLSSFLTWFTFFEIGLGSGLRNKLAEALAVKNYQLGKIYVSTTYAILTIVISVVALLFFIGNTFLDWSKILNTDKVLTSVLSSLALIVFGFFFLRFVMKLIGIILYADQRPAIANSFGPLGNLLVLIVIYILTKTTDGSLLYLGLTISIIPVLVLFVVSLYFYRTDYRDIAPSYKYVKVKYARNLLGLGVKFFIIQISALIMFQSSNIIIAQFFGPSEVTSYNIAYKYFGIISMLFSLVMIPYWSAFTDAWVKKEIDWINNTIRNLLKVFAVFVFIAIILFLLAPFVYDIWLGKENMKTIKISNVLELTLILYFLLFSFGGVYNMFINGTGKVYLQMISLLCGALIFFPLTYFFVKIAGMGIEGVVLGTILANFYSPIIAPLQYIKLIKNKAHGIWNK